MSRPLDHLVIGVNDLDAAGKLFADLGFVVGPVNHHPWGTINRIIQFSDLTFLELIAVAKHDQIPAHGPWEFSFGAFVRDAIAKSPGLSMLVLKSIDAAADSAVFRAAGWGDFGPFHFSRKAVGPKGNQTEVAFSLAFAVDPMMPQCGFFTCQHHFPENFWSSRAQSHFNLATGIARVTLVAENPSDHHIFLAGFVGERRMRSTSFGIEIEAGHGLIDIVSPEGFAFRYGEPAPASETPVFAGIEIACSRLSMVEAELDAAGEIVIRHGGGLTLPRRPDLATTLRFVEGGARS